MRRPPKRTPIDPRGLHVVGPGFYLWDADPQEALRLAAELGKRTARPSPLRPRRTFRAPLA